MEWEVRLIEWLQAYFGSFGSLVKLFAFLGGEVGLLMVVLIVMFCWKKEVGQRLALIVSCSSSPLIRSFLQERAS